TNSIRSHLWIPAPVTHRRLRIIALIEIVEGQQISTAYIDPQVLDLQRFHHRLWKSIADLQVLYPHVGCTFHPETGCLFIVGLVPRQSGISGIGIIGSPSILVLLLYGATKEERHNTLAVQITVRFANPLEKQRDIKTFVIGIEACSEGVPGNWTTNYRLVPVIDDPVIVKIPVLDVPWAHIAKLRGMIVHFFLRLE